MVDASLKIGDSIYLAQVAEGRPWIVVPEEEEIMARDSGWIVVKVEVVEKLNG